MVSSDVIHNFTAADVLASTKYWKVNQMILHMDFYEWFKDNKE